MDLSLRYRRGLVHTDDVARREKIPRKYLEQVLLEITRAGLLASRRGGGGGYIPAKSPDQITIGDVLRIVDGPLRRLGCMSDRLHTDCPDKGGCGLRSVMEDVCKAISETLNGVTFEDVSRRTIDLRKANSQAARREA